MGPTLGRCPVKVPIRGLDQTCLGGGTVGLVEGVQRGQRTGWSDFKNRAIVEPAGARCPVEVPISGLHQPRGWVFAVPASAFGTKTVERGQRATGPTAPIRSPVKTPISSLDQARVRTSAVLANALGNLRAKTVQRGQRAFGGDFEDRSEVIRPATVRRPVEVPIGSLRQRRSWRTASGVIKAN